ncbi:MAG: GT4 family glycosyltransferase PelF [Myxococcales bacterium]
MNLPTLRGDQGADVALLVEGTYPFARGSASNWVHKLIESMPRTTFSIVSIAGRRMDHRTPAYQLPPNVVHFESHHLFESGKGERGARFFSDGRAFRDFDLLLEHLRAAELDSPLDPKLVKRIALSLGRPGGLSSHSFLHGEAGWEWISDNYRRDGRDISFTDYFWTVRATHVALFALADIALHLPPARLYHSLCGGCAGFLGALLSQQRSKRLVLTEHGLYPRERMVDLASAETFPGDGTRARAAGGRLLWTRFFQGLAKVAYAAAHWIVSPYEGQRRRQLDDGADPAHTWIIPDGVEVERFAPLRKARGAPTPAVLVLIGRVVPMKDVKTFIRATKAIVAVRPDAEAWIVGPTTHDPGYAAECLRLASDLGLERKTKFLGFRKPEELLASAGLVVLTSVSEGLPLELLEAFASGVPVVATDVGACRDLIEGKTPADRALGSAGAVAPVADPEAIAQASLSLLDDPVRWSAAQKAAVRRVDAYYTDEHMIEAYRQLYREAWA